MSWGIPHNKTQNFAGVHARVPREKQRRLHETRAHLKEGWTRLMTGSQFRKIQEQNERPTRTVYTKRDGESQTNDEQSVLRRKNERHVDLSRVHGEDGCSGGGEKSVKGDTLEASVPEGEDGSATCATERVAQRALLSKVRR